MGDALINNILMEEEPKSPRKGLIESILCAECQEKPPIFYCPYCNSHDTELSGYCEECEEDAHKRRAIRFHKELLINFADYAKIWEDDHLIVTKKDHLKDQVNLVCFLKGKKLKVGPKVQDLSNYFKEDENIYSISFLGPSGVGKSRLLRILFEHKDSKPLPASKKFKTTNSSVNVPESEESSLSSTSSDIHGYFTEIKLEGEEKNTPLILYDSEGIGGTTKPQSLLFDILPKQFSNYSEFKEYRKQIVNIVYPRLMYLFNDVICFPYCGSAREQGTLLEKLILFAEIATSRSSNTGYFPALVIIFNKQNPDDENLWDPDNALREWNKVTGTQELNRYYDSVNVIYIPDSRGKPHLFIQQIHRLRSIIFDLVKLKKEKKSFYQINLHKREYFLLFRTAIKMFSKDYNAKFNFFDLISSIQKRSSVDPVDQLTNYFFYHFALNGNNYHQAIDFILHRLSDLIVLENYRSKIGTYSSEFLAINRTEDGGAELPEKYVEILVKFQAKISHLSPCTSSKQFGDKIVHCESRRQFHHSSFHTSSETYQKQVAQRVKKASKKGAFSEVSFVTSACRWEGAYEPPDDAALVDQFIVIFSRYWKENSDSIRKKKKFLEHRARWLRDFSHLSSDPNLIDSNRIDHKNSNGHSNEEKIIQINKSQKKYFHVWKKFIISVCLSCVLQVPSEVINCGHSLCIDCINENVINSILFCPLCDHSQPFSQTQIPPSAGVRILSLDGGGIRGIVELMILKKVEDRIHVPIVKAFDLISGTSTGGIITLFLTHANKSTDEVLTLFKDIPKKIFQRRLPLLPWFFLNYRYNNKELKKFVKTTLEKDNEMIRFSVPKVFVTSTTVSNTGSLIPVLFTSYIRQAKEYLPQVVISKGYKAALATSAAGTYFPVYTIDEVDYTDGGMIYNCPAAPAIIESKEIFGDRRIDVLLSIGNYERSEKLKSKIALKEEKIRSKTEKKLKEKLQKREKKIEKLKKKIDKEKVKDRSGDGQSNLTDIQLLDAQLEEGNQINKAIEENVQNVSNENRLSDDDEEDDDVMLNSMNDSHSHSHTHSSSQSHSNHSLEFSIGNNNNITEKLHMNLISFLKETVELVTSTQSGVDNAYSILKLTSNENEFVRISPTLSKEFPLDEKSSKVISTMQAETTSYLEGEGKVLVDKAYRLIVASFFYLDYDIEMEHDICKQYEYYIKCRIELPMVLWNELLTNAGGLSSLFSIQVKDTGEFHSIKHSVTPLPQIAADLTIATVKIYFESSGTYLFDILLQMGDVKQCISGCPLSIAVLKSSHIRVL